MLHVTNEDFFNKPISSHPFSVEFIDMCFNLHFRSLADIFSWPVNQLIKLDGFSYHHYHELWKYLAKSNLKGVLRF